MQNVNPPGELEGGGHCPAAAASEQLKRRQLSSSTVLAQKEPTGADSTGLLPEKRSKIKLIAIFLHQITFTLNVYFKCPLFIIICHTSN